METLVLNRKIENIELINKIAENAKNIIFNLDLNKEEQAKLDNSCKVIKEMREQSIDKIIKG